MRSRSTIIAALSLAAATIVAVAACGSSVTGSAELNTAAAQTLTSTSSSSSSTSSSSRTSTSSESSDTSTESVPTDLSELTALLSGLPTDLSIPTDFTLPTDFTIPSDFADLTNLNIPGYNGACLSVASAYASISLALLPALFGGTDGFNAGDLQKALDSLGTNVPAGLAPDFQTMASVAAQANGKSLTEASQLLDGDDFTTAQSHIDAWLSANCGG
jgi:hypothetical protein